MSTNHPSNTQEVSKSRLGRASYFTAHGDCAPVELNSLEVPDVIPEHEAVCDLLGISDPWEGFVIATILHFNVTRGGVKERVAISYTLLDRFMLPWWQAKYYIIEIEPRVRTFHRMPRVLVWCISVWLIMNIHSKLHVLNARLKVAIQTAIDDGWVDSCDHTVSPDDGNPHGMYGLSPKAQRLLEMFGS